MNQPPFTIAADLDLGSRVAPYFASDAGAADVTICEGPMPNGLDEGVDQGTTFKIGKDWFTLEVPMGARYFVEGGNRIVYERNGVTDREVALFLLGSAWGALCYQRGLLPLHASAVVSNDRVVSFTGPSGAGKSTLAAALADRGLEFFTDDVLIIDPSQIGEHSTVCYAGQKDMKLWSDALKLVESEKGGPVRDIEGFGKYFATPKSTDPQISGILDSIVVLKNENVRTDNDPIEFKRIRGGEALMQLRGSIYRQRYGLAIMGRPTIYSILAKLIATLEIHQFDRPRVKSQFDQSTSAMETWLRQRTSGQ